MTRDLRIQRSLLPCLLVLALALTFRSGRAKEGPEKPAPSVEGVIYEVFHRDWIHRMGCHVREVLVPSRNLAFYVSNGELCVFRPETHRYLLPGETIERPMPDGTPVRVPVLTAPGRETRRVGIVRLLAADVDRLEAHLEEKIRLRALADKYLTQGDPYQPVVAFATLNPAVWKLVAGRLDEAGILWLGISGGGSETLSVPAARAGEARRVLREALIRGLAIPPPDGPAWGPTWDDPLDFRILDPDGHVEWSIERTRVPPAPPHADVLEHLRRFPGSEWVTENGRKRQPEYGDLRLEEADGALSGKLPRPWTVKRLMEAYRRAMDSEGELELHDETARSALITLLAASRNPLALPLVGAGLGADSLDVRVAATEGINTYWDPEPLGEGGLEDAMLRAQAWWDARQR